MIAELKVFHMILEFILAGITIGGICIKCDYCAKVKVNYQLEVKNITEYEWLWLWLKLIERS